MHQLVNRLVRGLHDIDEPFMRLDHKILAAVPINKRTSRDVVVRPVGRKGYGSHDLSAGAYGGVQNLLTAVVNDPTVIRF